MNIKNHLVLESVLRDGEVEERHLDRGLGRVVRVGELGRHVEGEVSVVGDGVLADTDDLGAALLEGLLEQDRLERGVELFAEVLENDGLAEPDRVLERAEEVLVTHLDDLERAILLHVLGPLVRLPLRVDHQRPSPRVGEDQPVLHRDRVGGQPCDDDDIIIININNNNIIIIRLPSRSSQRAAL
jgi:hypothetical protein